MSDFDVGQHEQGANGRGCVTRVHALLADDAPVVPACERVRPQVVVMPVDYDAEAGAAHAADGRPR
ncbi:hypothetical protein [Streptomyces rubrogriseus]|uniref:hypothetical protein n=1 Tax=Streptomyces rubrogriseus TaxID=194673 RepID=UPI00131EFB78|nr:hypothetical protein [Streptomyces rubrogriseus]